MRLVPSSKAERQSVPVRVPQFTAAISQVTPRVLDFDVETVAAGFADPDWVPQKITCVAWSWVGSTFKWSGRPPSRPRRPRRGVPIDAHSTD